VSPETAGSIKRCIRFSALRSCEDLVAQEYGRYFNMKVGIFRGRLPDRAIALRGGAARLFVRIGESHSTAQYSVFGYKGKQVRDNIHSHDVVRAIEEFAANPRGRRGVQPGGRPREQHFDAEAIERIEQMTGRKLIGVTWTKRARAITFVTSRILES